MALLLPFCDKLATLWVPIGMSPMPAIKSAQWLSPRVKFGKCERAALGAELPTRLARRAARIFCSVVAFAEDVFRSRCTDHRG